MSRLRIARPRRPIGWVLVSPFALVALMLTVTVALVLLLVMPRGSRNRNVAAVCADCGYLEQGYHTDLLRCSYGDGGNGWVEGEMVTWNGEFYKRKARSLT